MISPAAAQNPEGPAANNLPAAQIGGEVPGDRVSNPDKQGDWPAIAYAKDGALFAIWIEWNDKDADRVLVRRRDPQGKWGSEVALGDGNWDHYSPTIVPRGDGAMAIWSGQSDGNYDLFAATVSASGQVSRPERLTSAPFSDFNARAVSDEAGNVTLVWQSFRSGNGDIYARRFSGDSWGPETRVSVSSSDDWEPAVALDRKGLAWISWDGYETGNYDVYLRSFDGRKLGNTIAMTTEPAAQFHSSVAVDGDGRVWVAWDDAGENWGKDFSRSSAAPGSRGLHYSRKIGMRVYAGGRVREPSADVSSVFTGRMQRYAELPNLAADSSGAMWLVFRHWTLPKPHEIYHFYATHLSVGKWSVPIRLTASSGQNTQRASLSLAPAGTLTVAYSSDGRGPEVVNTDPMHAAHYNVYISHLPKGGGPPVVEFSSELLPAAQKRPPPRARATTTVNGKTYRLMMGDAHRHTDIRGHSGVDGSVLDTYRYAMDAARLDWLGTSDHNEVTGGRWPDGLRDYQWWTTQKTVDLMSHPPVFFGVYSYEHSLQRPSGHRNILYLKRGGPLRAADRERKPDDNLPPNLWEWMTRHALTQPGQKVIVVPHTFGESSQPLGDFKWDNARFDCLLEIYQGARSSYEAFRAPAGERRGNSQIDEPGHFAQDSLAAGNVYGFVSFSDHGSTHNSWAAVWAPTEDRAGLFDGMYARRTYAASDEIIVKADADSHMPGEEFGAPAGKAPMIEAEISAPDTILRIDVVKDAKYIYTTRPNSRTASIRFRDNDAKPGKSYYYLRVFQRDTEKPDGDPEVAWTSPWYVTYR
ncbi:MAG: hypothetical protein M3Z23_13300 [Acidobacteriota bacterium]|nr:hypothetical protein [Acidobacteriota bacterium]